MSLHFVVLAGPQIVRALHALSLATISHVIDIWFTALASILPQIQKEFNPIHVEYATLALYVGLIIGASTWGILADIIGRRLSFNMTLLITSVFAIAAAGANDLTTISGLLACVGFGVGGKYVFCSPSSSNHQ
jgi:MFS family permease